MKLTLKAAAAVLLLTIPYSLALAQVSPGKPRAKATPPPAARPIAPASSPGPRAANSSGAPERLDGIAAVVNDDVVLESDVEEQLYLFVQQARIRPDSALIDSMRKEVLSQIVDFRLVVAEAKKQGLALTPTDQRLIGEKSEESLRDTKGRFQSEEEFRQTLQRDNTTEAKLREKYRGDLSEQLLAQRLRDKQIPKRPVSAAEAEAFFRANPGKFPKVPAQVKLQVIQIPPAADSVAEAKAKAKIIDVRKRLTAGGEKFAKVAGELSEDENTARSGGDLGFLPRGALDGALDQAVADAKLHVLSPPVRSSAGWHLFEVLERDTIRTAAGSDSTDRLGKPALESHVRHILVRVALEEKDIERARQTAERVRNEAAKGGDFGALARRYSKYQGQVDPDGDLGYVSMGAFQPAIHAALDTVAVGTVSSVIENPIGFNVFKVNDRKPERTYTFEEVKDQLPGAVEEIKDRERWDTWLKTLRAKSHIEIRGS